MYKVQENPWIVEGKTQYNAPARRGGYILGGRRGFEGHERGAVGGFGWERVPITCYNCFKEDHYVQ